MDDRSDRDILIGTATRVEAIERDVKEIKDTQKETLVILVDHSVELGKLKNNPNRIRNIEDFVANLKGKYAIWAALLLIAVGVVSWLLRQ